MKRLDVSTDKVWLWGRLQAKQGEDTAPVLALQKQFSVAPLSKKTSTATLPALPDIGNDEFDFFKQLAFALQTTDIKPADKALFAQFERIGHGLESTVFVLGSAIPHPHPLRLGNYSVHTSAQALAVGEGRIRELGQKLKAADDRVTPSGSTGVQVSCCTRYTGGEHGSLPLHAGL